MADDDGVIHNVTFTGVRQEACGTHSFNNAVVCSDGGDNASYPQITYAADANEDLPVGHYTGHITFNGVEWHTMSPLLAYDITTSLTVE